jgi:hypothetical protein
VKIKIIIVIVLIFFSSFNSFVAADNSNAIIFRSGTIDNDDIDEPLNAEVSKYSGILAISNEIMDLIFDSKYKEIHANYFDDELKNLFPINSLISFHEEIKNKFGKLVSYKKQQWYFVLFKEDGKDILLSVKIVHHEKAIIYYRFAFHINNLEKIGGFQIQIKEIVQTKKSNSI